jgi:hypothetical protein
VTVICEWCGEPMGVNGHAEDRRCPHVRAMVMRKDGTVKRVEFFTPRERVRLEYGDKVVEGWKDEDQGTDEAGPVAGGGAAAGRPHGRSAGVPDLAGEHVQRGGEGGVDADRAWED